MRRGRFLLVVLLTVAVGVVLRTATLSVSPLPFNPDGLVYAGHVRDTRAADRLLLDTLATDELHFTAFLTVVSEVTGVNALYHSQWVIALVGTLPALFLVGVIRRLGGSLGLDAGRARLAGGLAGLTLAVEGFYLHRSMPVDEQTLGLFLVPLAVVGVVRAHRDSRWWLPVAAVFVVLPSIHNLDAMVLALTLSVLAGLAIGTTGRLRGRTVAVVALAFWGWFAAYNYGVEAFTGARIIQQARITAVPGLLLAWALLVAIVLVWFVGRGERFQRGLVATTFASWFVLLAANTVTPLFPGLFATHTLVLVGVFPLAIPLGLAALGMGDSVADDLGLGLLCLGGGVLVLAGVSLSAALTADYYNMLYRVQTFLHLPVMGLAAYVLVRKLDWSVGRGTVGSLAVVVLLVSVSVSVPIAYSGLSVLSYKGVTTPAEFESAGFAVEHSGGEWTSDDHLSRVSWYYSSDGREDRVAGVAPTYEWLASERPPGCLTLSQHSWTTVGAQLYPKQQRVVGDSRYSRLVESRNQVYAVSGKDPILGSVPVLGRSSGC
ncbi:hypothetical protein [Haloarchaeobius sp. HRN-SO-5]|uniref:hypothetical protein n=1 Tax=Haloarchaeobius sp. HRN-SO-5 TaxID=3446118 RepID=UPI003EBAC24F